MMLKVLRKIIWVILAVGLIWWTLSCADIMIHNLSNPCYSKANLFVFFHGI